MTAVEEVIQGIAGGSGAGRFNDYSRVARPIGNRLPRQTECLARS